MLLENISSRCKENGISIHALEKRLNIGNGTIARWEKSYPRADKLKSVADYFGCTMDELLRKDDS